MTAAPPQSHGATDPDLHLVVLPVVLLIASGHRSPQNAVFFWKKCDVFVGFLRLTLWYSNDYITVCYWKWPIEIVDLPNLKMAIFHSYVHVYQRVDILRLRGCWVDLWRTPNQLVYAKKATLAPVGLGFKKHAPCPLCEAPSGPSLEPCNGPMTQCSPFKWTTHW